MNKRLYFIYAFFLLFANSVAWAGDRYNFNADWIIALGDRSDGGKLKCNERGWKHCTLPYAWNQSEAFSRNCSELSDTVMWYRKHFKVPAAWKGKKVFVEFEGVRFAAKVLVNGKELGWSENGVMAFGFDITPHLLYGADNVIAVRVDNDWNYKEREGEHAGFQWNNKNFYCNYGGINKNVWLHVMNGIYQTLPLYSNLKTTGVYVAPVEFSKTKRDDARILCEAQVVNSTSSDKVIRHKVVMVDMEGREVSSIEGEERNIKAGDTIAVSTLFDAHDLHLWSWGYGYLYKVRSMIMLDGVAIDTQEITTGFRKTAFKDGMFYLNDRVLQLKGFAQRSTNEWPSLGISLPSWMSDYSNALALECNANFFRWMHVTPSKQDVRSFDRLGLMQAMPAGDAEKDVEGRRWEQRLELMRDAIIYNRNNPSIIFYEGGNNQISEQHMEQLKALRDVYDPHGGRAIGSRNMLDSKVAEYGGEMLYVNKSAGKPMWQMEYNRDEGIRRYWDKWSYPYHVEGEGPLYRGDRAVAYNHNQDGLAIENIVRWNEYWMARPGMGKRVNSGGAKIIFSDSNTHARGEKNYRTSGVVDAMRIPKDSWYVLQTMWDGWVDTERDHTYIIGHWNYGENSEKVTKPVYVCSTGDEVELYLNGVSLGQGRRSSTFLFTFDDVEFKPGTLIAVSRRNGEDVSYDVKETADEPVMLRMHWVKPSCINEKDVPNDPLNIHIAEIEAVDAQGRRHPLSHDMIHFKVEGDGEYIGGISGVVSEEEKAANAADALLGHDSKVKEGHSNDTNGIGSPELMLEAGVIRVMVRANDKEGRFSLVASPLGESKLGKAVLNGKSVHYATKGGFYVDDAGNMIEADWAKVLPSHLKRGETPVEKSYVQKYNTVEIDSIEVACNNDKAQLMADDNEGSEWSSDGFLQNSWVKVVLERDAEISRIVLRLKNFRSTSYPLQVFADDVLVWEGYTPKTLGDCYIDIPESMKASHYTIKMIGPATVKDAFGTMPELAAKQRLNVTESKSNVLSIIEMSFDESVK